MISSVTSPHNFHLQLVSFSEHLNSLLIDLEKTYNHPEMIDNVEWKIYSPKIGMFGLHFDVVFISYIV